MLKRSTFDIPKMDCAAEERLVRMALESLDTIRKVQFDLPSRRLTVSHSGAADAVLQRLLPLGFGAKLTATVDETDLSPPEAADAQEARTLRLLLAINAFMFLVEIVTGIAAQSTGLIADSLDMLADAAVYGLSLYAVGKAAQQKVRAAHLSGWFQKALSGGVLIEVARRFLYGSEPMSSLMVGISLLALAANLTCLWLISAHRHGGAHMKASWIFSSNDVLANIGVITAGALVA